MSALTSMLVPVETLSLVPLALERALENTPLNVLLLLVGLPLVAGVVIAVVTKMTTRSHHGADVPNTDPTWIGSKAQHDPVLGTDNAAGKAAQQGGPGAEESAASSRAAVSQGAIGSQPSTGGQVGNDDKGGASARW